MLPVPGFWEKCEEMNGDSVQYVPGWALYETGAQRELTPMGVAGCNGLLLSRCRR